MTPSLTFDLETIPDILAIRRLYKITDDFSDQDVVNIVMYQRRQKVGHNFLQHHLQKIVAISCVLKTDEQLQIWSLGEEESSEAELLERFYDGVEKYLPNLVTWNGTGFDLPVLNYRSLVNKVSSSIYFDVGENNSDFKWNNYLNRFHQRHIDLMDFFGLYSGRNNASLDHIAKLCGFPGKLDMDGGQVWKTYLKGNKKSIRDYCETDVVNTYLVYLSFLLIKTHINKSLYEKELLTLQKMLESLDGTHWKSFIQVWQK